MSQSSRRWLIILLSILSITSANSINALAGCPTGQISKSGKSFNATVFDKQGHDIDRILGAPDASFAKLDKNSEYVILKLDKVLSPGQKVTLYFASYNDNSTTAVIQGSSNGASFFGSTSVSTSVKKDDVDSASVSFTSNVRYVKITFPEQSGMGDLMLDALAAEEEVCFVDLDLVLVTPVCVNASTDVCLNDLFNFDSAYDNANYSFNDNNNTSTGYVYVTSSNSSSSNEDCCDAGKPTELTFRYMSSSEVNNNQGSKSSVTTYQATNGNDVLIVANDNSSPTDLSDPYFSKVVSSGEAFTIDQTNGSWGSNMYLHVMTTNGNTALQLIGFHTSCSAPIIPGDQFGYLKLTGTLVEGAVCGDPNDGECMDLFSYNPAPNSASTDTVLLDICFEKSGAQFCDQLSVVVSVTDTTCGASVVVQTNTCKNTPIELCLAEIVDLDSVFGTSDVTLTSFEGTSGEGYVVTNSASSNDAEDCCDFGKPTKLTFRYESANVDDNNQPDGKSSVTTYSSTNGNKVLIVANSSSTPNDLSDPYMSVLVEVGESFILTQNNGSWSSNTYFHILDSTGSNVIQLVQFHTSCSAPVVPGDRFGYITLLASEIDGVTCGQADNEDCKDGIVYFPNVDFKGTDAFNLEVCRIESGKQVCEVVRVNVVVVDSSCNTGCPDNGEKVVVASTFDAIVSSDAHDEDKATENPDGEFAKLEHSDEFMVLSLREYLQAGEVMDLIIASYGGDLAKGVVYGSYDGVTFGPPMAISTSQKKPLTKTEQLTFGFDVQFVKIVRDNSSEDKLLIDGASFDGTVCRPGIPDTIRKHMCVDAPTTWNLNDVLPSGATVKDYTVTKTSGPATGSYSLENNYQLEGCTLDDPKSFNFKYVGGTCLDSDNEQEGDFKCTDLNSLDGFSSVYVVVNDNNDINKRLTDNDQFFVGNVSLNGTFTVDAANNGDSKLPGKVYVWVMNPANNEVLQKMEIKTDCNKPINLYDQFASMLVTRYEAKNGNGVLSEITEMFKSDYTPATGFSGTDQVVLQVCETGNAAYCQDIVVDLDISTIAPVAQNDTVENQPVTSGTSVSYFDLLANDSHSGGEQLKVQTPIFVGPSLSGAMVVYDTTLQRAVYTIDNPKNGDIDSFTYIIRSECAEDTAMAFIAFGGPVPVTWLDFTATLVGANDVELNWSTAAEENNSHFVVERSLDGESFTQVGDFVTGAGNSTEINAYVAIDLNVPKGAIYYRIKQIDFDGQFDYSEVRWVMVSERRSIVVYPNPVKNEINVQVNGANGEVVTIANMAGQQLTRVYTTNGGFAHIDVTDYPNGLYFITIESNLHTEVRKVLIQK